MPCDVVSMSCRSSGENTYFALVKSPSVNFLGSLENPNGRLKVSSVQRPILSSETPTPGRTVYAIFVPSAEITGFEAPEKLAGDRDGTFLKREMLAWVTISFSIVKRLYQLK